MRYLYHIVSLIGPFLITISFILLIGDPRAQKDTPLYNPWYAIVIHLILSAGSLIFLIAIVYRTIISKQEMQIQQLEQALRDAKAQNLSESEKPIESFAATPEEELAQRISLAEVEAQDP